jgi:hypothetical protein
MGESPVCAATLNLRNGALVRVRVVSALVFLGGCASYGSHLSASPTAPGNRELALSADVLVIDRGVGPQVLPNPEIGLRLGLVDDLDIGGRLNAGGFEGNARWRVLASEAFDLAVVPGLGFGFVPVTNADSGIFNANGLATVLGGVKVGSRTDLVFGMRGVATYAFPLTAFRGDASGAKMLYLPGGMIGMRMPVGKTSYVFPDVSVLRPYDSERDEWYFPTIQGGVSLQFE